MYLPESRRGLLCLFCNNKHLPVYLPSSINICTLKVTCAPQHAIPAHSGCVGVIDFYAHGWDERHFPTGQHRVRKPSTQKKPGRRWQQPARDVTAGIIGRWKLTFLRVYFIFKLSCKRHRLIILQQTLFIYYMVTLTIIILWLQLSLVG